MQGVLRNVRYLGCLAAHELQRQGVVAAAAAGCCVDAEHALIALGHHLRNKA